MNNTADREITLSRTFAFPQDLIWRAYTEPEHFVHWYGPDGFTVTIDHMDVRIGGSSQFIMHGPDGTDYDNHMAYTQVMPSELLAFDHGSRPDDPESFKVNITFKAVEGGTHVTSLITMKTVEACEHVKGFGAIELGQQTFAKLDKYLQSL